MKKIYLIAILLTGCAADQPPAPYWQKGDTVPVSGAASKSMQPIKELTPEQIVIRDKARADMAICKYEAAKATGSSQRGYSVYSTLFNDVGDTFREAQLIELCLQAKGYGKK